MMLRECCRTRYYNNR